jgi:hypothetical protein
MMGYHGHTMATMWHDHAVHVTMVQSLLHGACVSNVPETVLAQAVP